MKKGSVTMATRLLPCYSRANAVRAAEIYNGGAEFSFCFV